MLSQYNPLEPSTVPVLLASEAQDDFRHVLMQAEREGGDAQRAAIDDALDHALTTLSANPNGGVARPDLADNVRMKPVGDYCLFYESHPKAVFVLRILHRSHDAQASY